MYSKLTQQYVEALARQGDNFRPHEWVTRALQREAKSKERQAVFASSDPSDLATKGLVSTPSCQHATHRHGLTPRPSSMRLRGHIRPQSPSEGNDPEMRLRRQLEKVRSRWTTFQQSRDRDAVYGYLESVHRLVERYRVRRKTKWLKRGAYQFANLDPDRNANVFTVLIRCTCGGDADNKTGSKWSRALRYAARKKTPDISLKEFMKAKGGINACADRYAKYCARIK